MPFKNENIRLQNIINMLKSLARGDFNKRIDTGNHKDDLESISILLNMLSEEWQERILHLSFIKPDQSYHYSTPLIVSLDANAILLNASYHTLRTLDLYWSDIGKIELYQLITPESKDSLKNALQKIIDHPLETASLSLIFNNGNLLQHYQAHLQCFHKEKRYQLTLYQIHIQHLIPIIVEPSIKIHLQQHSYEEIKIQKIHDYLHQHPMEQPLHIDFLCKQFGINQYSLKTLFKAQYQTSLYQYYLHLRMNNAYLLITQTTLPLNKIAYMTGFKNYHNFFRNFLNVYGIQPNTLRKK